MAHEIYLETAERKASQLNTLLYLLSQSGFVTLDGQQLLDLVELAGSLAD